jgi:hypothetical protein
MERKQQVEPSPSKTSPSPGVKPPSGKKEKPNRFSGMHRQEPLWLLYSTQNTFTFTPEPHNAVQKSLIIDKKTLKIKEIGTISS